MALKTRYNSTTNMYEIGYYQGMSFIIVQTQRAL